MNPTLLLDEADNVVTKNNNPELLAILNSGHNKKGAYVVRSTDGGGGWKPHKFPTFAPIAFAGIKALPETLQDRSLVIKLKRALPGEQKEHLRDGDSPVLIVCRRKIARWMQDLTEISDPDLPAELYNRAGDNWRPLFALAELAGGQWPDLYSERRLIRSEAPTMRPNCRVYSYRSGTSRGQKSRAADDRRTCAALNKEEEGGWSQTNHGRGVNDYWYEKYSRTWCPTPLIGKRNGAGTSAARKGGLHSRAF